MDILTHVCSHVHPGVMASLLRRGSSSYQFGHQWGSLLQDLVLSSLKGADAAVAWPQWAVGLPFAGKLKVCSTPPGSWGYPATPEPWRSPVPAQQTAAEVHCIHIGHVFFQSLPWDLSSKADVQWDHCCLQPEAPGWESEPWRLEDFGVEARDRNFLEDKKNNLRQPSYLLVKRGPSLGCWQPAWPEPEDFTDVA